MEDNYSQQWFSLAIQAGHLSIHKEDKSYVGNYMFMGTRDGLVYFKHIDTREYHNIKAEKLLALNKPNI